ncbi:MAG TPA: DUF1223 domain-containing protein [Steroidobacteraceae bacterium]|jgi:hypothetical protein|nr:DUF1223 domain-containing protein [Steroidobacteraceae bacterium]
MRNSLHNYLMAGTLLCWAAAGHTEPRPAVVELFTSEGCSSCPPAEAYLGELAQRRDVIALAFHVDYWDDLGWRDRFGLPGAVKRQDAYARALRLASAYTPQVVIDGHNDFVGSDRNSIGRALGNNRSGVAVALSVRDGEVFVDLGAQEGVAPCDVLLVTYLRTAVSPIGRGENAGRTLKEFNIVRDFHSLGRWDGKKQRYHSPLKALPSDATDVAVLVQPLGQAPIVGAASIALR